VNEESGAQTGPVHPKLRPLVSMMTARDRDESHRAATPLELFFDLVFVVAIAAAASGLHHAVGDGHPWEGLLHYVLVFFAIWWAWMNFTWFASGYDPDDVPYRLFVFVQITGALILAAGVPAGFVELDFRVMAVGYVVMRLGMAALLLRAARADPSRARTIRRYAVGVAVLQIGWVALVFIPGAPLLPGFLTLIVLELLVPVWTQRDTAMPWHPHHIAERFGLLTIIVLGESILAASIAIQAALSSGAAMRELTPVIVGGLLTIYALWWLYFDEDAGEVIASNRTAHRWAYGHYVIFGAGAALGAGLAVAVDVVMGHSAISEVAAAVAVAVPAALFLVAHWALHLGPSSRGVERWAGPAAGAVVLLTPMAPEPVLATGLTLAALLAVKLTIRHRGGPNLV